MRKAEIVINAIVAKKKLFNFTKPSRTIQDPEIFGALVEQIN